MSLTLSELNSALKPLMSAINISKTEATAINQEICEKLECILARLDLLEHQQVPIETQKPAKKKSAASDEPVKKPVVNRVLNRTTASKKTEVEESKKEASESDHEESDAESEKQEAPEPAKRKKAAAVKPTAPKRVTIMSAFKETYERDPTYFDEYLTPEVRESLAQKTPQLNELTGKKLQALELTTYYKYMASEHKELLVDLRDSMK